MKTLQNNFTTPEQSQRLLDLGVPVTSADCYYMIICGKVDNQIEVICNIDTFRDNCEYLRDYFPCWSVGRLIEIVFICSEARTIDFWRNDSPMQDIIEEFENNKMDFSKLED